MSTNCLVKDLKGACTNQDLYKFNELRMFLPAGVSMRLQGNSTIVTGKQFTITALSGSFTYDGNTYTAGNTATVVGGTRKDLAVPSTTDAVISISDKQAIIGFNFTGNRVSSISGKHIAILNPDFGYLDKCVEVYTYMAYDAETLGKFPVLTKLGHGAGYQKMSPYVWRRYVNHDNFPLLEELVFSSLDQTDQVNISTFASLITLTFARFTQDVGCVGSLESLAQGMVDAGRTSGTLDVYPNNVITYNGEACDNTKHYTIAFSSGSYTITPSA